MIRLGVNIDHVATVRQARLEKYPSPAQAALLAELGGADNITCHLREDRRHIQDADVEMLRRAISVPLNFEMAATAEMIDFASRIKPGAATIVPEKREELTTEGGLNFTKESRPTIKDAILRLEEAGISVALFVDPNKNSVECARELGASAIELHTGVFCRDLEKTPKTPDKVKIVEALADIASHASQIGLQVHFGHGLHYSNANWLQHIPCAEEANIGHAIIGRAMFVGLKNAVHEMKDLLNDPKYRPFTSR